MFCELVLVNNQSDTVVDQWIARGSSQTKQPDHKQFFTGSRSLLIEPGAWKVKLTVQDLVDTLRILKSAFTSTVRSFGLSVDVSDIMFTLPHNTATTGFTRNGVDAAPNPRAEMIGTDPSISFYSELYNALSNKHDTVLAAYTVLNYAREELMTVYQLVPASSNGIVLREDIPAGALHTGAYTLVLHILEKNSHNELATTEKRFFILNPDLPPNGTVQLTEEQAFLSSEWAECSGDKLKLELELSRVLASRAELITESELNDERAQQRYLFRFWKTRDPDPTTPQNARLDEFRKLKERADAFYKPGTGKTGWQSDRGRILLKYGIPTQTTQHIQELDTKPYDVWFYQNYLGGVYFYFVDMHLLQDHRLVHSTMLGEVNNENWFNLYAKAFSPNPNPTESLQPTNR